MMKMINIFFFLVLIFSKEMFCAEKELIPLSKSIPIELWEKIGLHMDKQKHRLMPEVIKNFSVHPNQSNNIDKELFEKKLKTYREPSLKNIAEKQASTDLRRSIFKKFDRPKPKFKLFNKTTGQHENLREDVKNVLDTYYTTYIDKNYSVYFLKYSRMFNVDEDEYENINNIPIKVSQADENIDGVNYKIEIFEDNAQNKTIKILDPEENLKVSVINAISEKYKPVLRIICFGKLDIQNDYNNIHEKNIIFQSFTGSTLLHDLAIYNQNDELKDWIPILIRDNIDPNVQDVSGNTALNLSIIVGEVDPPAKKIEKLLQLKNIDLDVKDGQEKTPLTVATQKDIEQKVAILKMLIGAGATHMNAALLYAAGTNNLEIITLLFQHNFLQYQYNNINIQENTNSTNPIYDGKTALHYSIENKNIELATLLLEHGANPNIKDKAYQTPLMIAISDGNLEMTKLLIKHDAISTFKDVVFALKNKQYNIAKSLLSCPRIQERMLFSFLLTLFGSVASRIFWLQIFTIWQKSKNFIDFKKR